MDDPAFPQHAEIFISYAAEDRAVAARLANELEARNTLVPATIEDCRLPLEFRRIEAAQIGRRWAADDDEFLALLEAVAGKVSSSSQSSKTVGAVRPRRQSPSDRRNRWLIAGASLLGVLVLALAAFISLPDGTRMLHEGLHPAHPRARPRSPRARRRSPRATRSRGWRRGPSPNAGSDPSWSACAVMRSATSYQRD